MTTSISSSTTISPPSNLSTSSRARTASKPGTTQNKPSTSGNVKEHDFFWTYTEEPHRTRRQAIIKAHPEVTKLCGPEPLTKYTVLLVVLIQLFCAFALQSTPILSWKFLLTAYIVGATANQNLFLAIHEISHNLAFRNATANRALAIFANLPIGIPYSASFRPYHLTHHKSLGIDGLDTDLPTSFEAFFLDSLLGKSFFATFQIFFYAIRPIFVYRVPFTYCHIANIVAQVVFDYLLVTKCSPNSLYYLIISSFLAGSLHPCGEAPRPGSGIASPVGHAALVGVSTYSFDSNVKSKVLYALHLPNASWSSTGEGYRPIQKPTPIVHNATSGIWLGPEEAAWIIDGTLYGKNLSAAAGVPDPKDHGFRIGAFPAAPQTMQVAGAGLDADRVQLVFSAQVYDDGDLAKVAEHDASEESQEWERVKVYDSTWVRHWDSWIRPTKRSQLFSVELRRDANGYKTSWTFSSPFRNLLKGTKLEAPTPPFGDEADYAVSIKAGLVAFTAKDPLVNPAWHTKQNIYVVPLDASSPPREVTSGKFGATSSPAFSPDSTHLAWLQMARDGFESDVRRVVIHHLASQRTSAILADWDRSPSAISWSADGKELYLTTEEHEQVKLFAIPLRTDKAGIFTDARKDDLTTLVHSGGLSAVDIIPGGGAVLTASNLTGPNDLYHMTPKGALTRLTAFGEWSAALGDVDFGPAPQRFNFSGAEGRESHGWIHRPPSYDSSLSYPLAVLIHGGPEGAWTNSWSLRWNPAVFAAAGFVTVTLDPAGSTGFGQKYQEGILRDWGGKAFYDIRAGVHHILDTFDNVDRERVVAAGASYGGFMINFIQGHNQDGLFKGLVSHDGVFSTLSTWYSTEELHFPEFQFGGVPWENRDAYLRFSPEQFTQNWATPQLTIAGGLDFRLPESEGLSVFNTLQRRGVPSRLVYFPKENHWVQSERNSKKWYDEVIGWLHKYSAPKEEQEPQGQAQQGQAGLTFQR